MFCDWKDDYSINVESIDIQHQKLFMMTKVLHGYIESGEPHKVMRNFLAELIKYTEQHFADEEKYIRDMNMPDSYLQEQIDEHKLLMKQVKDTKAEFDSKHAVFTPKLIHFLVDWLKNHIVRVDQKMVEFSGGSSQK